ncbi:MAG TPA: TetR/AcrR family transcriptional regulator [Polyangia bacterium]|nr:TetR/AcrR family transcriptional regulator [Polyangia bacterium]
MDNTFSIATEGRSPRKLAVLDAAITLFAEKGYDSVSVRDIGDLLDQTGPSIYRHYGSKEELLADAVAVVIIPMIDALRKIANSPAPASDRLEEAILFHASFALRHRVYLRVYYRDSRHLSETARRVHRRRAGTYRGLWTRLLIESGAAESDDEAIVLYEMLMAMLNVGTPKTSRLGDAELLDLVAARAAAMLAGE